MSRAVFLPTPGDPCLLTLWFKYYQRWSDEVDRLYVYVNSDSPRPVISYIKNLVKSSPKTFLIFFPKQIEHGEALKQLVSLASEDYIMFIEDDAFIFRPGKVEACFKLIENGEYDAVGSKRGSCGLWLYRTASEIYKIDNSGYGDNGPNFWPCYFFAKRSDLLKVHNFAAKFWPSGHYIQWIRAETPEDTASDTFVEGSLQLRYLGLKFWYEPQYHGNTDDSEDYEKKMNIWDGEAAWLHVGSLSSGFHGMLKQGYVLDREHFSTDAEKLELERRVCFYQMAFDAMEEKPTTKQIMQDYHKGIMRLVEGYGLDQERIRQRIKIYKEVMDVEVQ